jgi:hypothetical protein
MPAQRLGLRMIKDVIRRNWEARLSHDKIAAALGLSKGEVQKYLALAGAAQPAVGQCRARRGDGGDAAAGPGLTLGVAHEADPRVIAKGI